MMMLDKVLTCQQATDKDMSSSDYTTRRPKDRLEFVVSDGGEDLTVFDGNDSNRGKFAK